MITHAALAVALVPAHLAPRPTLASACKLADRTAADVVEQWAQASSWYALAPRCWRDGALVRYQTRVRGDAALRGRVRVTVRNGRLGYRASYDFRLDFEVSA